MIGVIVLVAALAAAGLLACGLRLKNGRFSPVANAAAPHDVEMPSPAERLSADEIGVALGERATLVQFSSAFCSPCRATRVLLTDVAGRTPGVVTVDVDAESHLELVRRYHVMRTPTVLVLDRAGRVVGRASGLPRREQVLAALEAVPG